MVIRDLGAEFWDHVDSIDAQSLQSLVAFIATHLRTVRRLDLDLLADGQRLDVDLLPLSSRIKNGLCRYFGDSQLPPRIAVWELLGIRAFGVRSLLEFSCIVEATQSSQPSPKLFESPPQRVKSPPQRVKSPPQRVKSPPQRVKNDSQSTVSEFFRVLAAWAAGEKQLLEIGSALPQPCADWPEEIRLLWEQIGFADTRKLAEDAIHKYSVPTLLSTWINSLDDRQHRILSSRVLVTGKPKTLDEIGESYCVTRERVRQIEHKAKKRLAEFRRTEYGPVLRRARNLRDRLGIAFPESAQALTEALTWVVADFGQNSLRDFAQQIFLWLSGPYRNHKGWLTADPTIVKRGGSGLLSFANKQAPISENEIRIALSDLGVREAHHQAWIDLFPEFTPVSDGLLLLSGSILDKAERLLRAFNRPMTAEELIKRIGSSSVRSLRQRLMDDSRFWRINKQNQFVLAGTDGYDEYTGIKDEIIQELEACGGSATVEHLVEKVSKTYGVMPTSVLAYLSTPLFVRNESNVVRVRKNEELRISTDISTTADCYRINDKWSWRAKVDHQMMKGSGRLCPNAFVRQLGCDLGDKIKVRSAFGDITISWQAGSINGAALGSIRAALLGLNAAVGDYVFIIANGREIQFQLLRKEKLEMGSPIERLACLVGVQDTKVSADLLPKVASALLVDQGVEPIEQQIRDTLIARGEHELSDLIDLPKLSVHQHLERIGSILGGADSSVSDR